MSSGSMVSGSFICTILPNSKVMISVEPSFFRSRSSWLIKVLLPVPNKPVTIYTGIIMGYTHF